MDTSNTNQICELCRQFGANCGYCDLSATSSDGSTYKAQKPLLCGIERPGDEAFRQRCELPINAIRENALRNPLVSSASSLAESYQLLFIGKGIDTSKCPPQENPISCDDVGKSYAMQLIGDSEVIEQQALSEFRGSFFDAYFFEQFIEGPPVENITLKKLRD